VTTRYRCSACGNLTRFDVVTSRRTRAFHHYTVGGDLTIEDESVVDERIEQVACRWCGTGTAVEQIDEASDGVGDDHRDGERSAGAAGSAVAASTRSRGPEAT
jgi:hypothetical protein